MDRRELLKLLAASVVASASPGVAIRSKGSTLSRSDEELLDDIERRGCLYFAEQASPNTGQVLDRVTWLNATGALDPRRMASIAATGFGLSCLCIAHKRNYHSRTKIIEQVRRTLRFHSNTLPHQHGFFCHFTDIETGQPFRNTEFSSIDTALLICGVLTARAYFYYDSEIVHLATNIYERIDWPWMLNGENTLSMGYRGSAFLNSRWNHYCELMMIYLLAIGSPTHPIDPVCWDAWSRPIMEFDGIKYIGAADPLFVHQYSHAWFDFRNKRDRHADYFLNSVLATRAHQAFCLSLHRPYSLNYWGISASDSQHGYTAWGGPGIRDPGARRRRHGFGGIDGSVVPYATAGSLPFLPADCLRVQHWLRDTHGPKAWGRYGFCDAFHPEVNYYDPDVLGIDLGISVLMAENLRTGFVWETFARNPEVDLAMQRVGFHKLQT